MFIFLLIMNSLVPFIMIFFGFLWQKNIPQNINYIYGYRTSMSMKNIDTWKFAHQYHSRIWLWSGIALFVLSSLAMFIFKSNYEIASLWIALVQIVVLFLTLIPTEKALRKKFDKDGNLK